MTAGLPAALRSHHWSSPSQCSPLGSQPPDSARDPRQGVRWTGDRDRFQVWCIGQGRCGNAVPISCWLNSTLHLRPRPPQSAAQSRRTSRRSAPSTCRQTRPPAGPRRSARRSEEGARDNTQRNGSGGVSRRNTVRQCDRSAHARRWPPLPLLVPAGQDAQLGEPGTGCGRSAHDRQPPGPLPRCGTTRTPRLRHKAAAAYLASFSAAYDARVSESMRLPPESNTWR